jgi:hypothetical protein
MLFRDDDLTSFDAVFDGDRDDGHVITTWVRLKPTDRADFDPIGASRALLDMADFAEHCVSRAANPTVEFFREAIDELRAAQSWLDGQSTPFELPRRDSLLEAADEGYQPAVDIVIDTLRETALEVVQIHEMLELRHSRQQ